MGGTVKVITHTPCCECGRKLNIIEFKEADAAPYGGTLTQWGWMCRGCESLFRKKALSKKRALARDKTRSDAMGERCTQPQ